MSATPPDVLRAVCGLQAQLLGAAWLGVRARSAGLRAADLDRALNQERSIVRTWLMRGTLHVAAADDIRWLLALLGPAVAGRNAARHRQLGLDDDLMTRAVKAIRDILAGSGPLTRYELVERLRRRHIRLDPKSQAPIHVIQAAALQGAVCLGPARDHGEPTYVLIDDWLGPLRPAPAKETPGEALLGELARRYIAAFGPASVEDLAAWAGLPIKESRVALSRALPALKEVGLRGRPAWILATPRRDARGADPGAMSVRLLPAFDSYLLGYRRRDPAVPTRLQARLQRGGGWLHPAVVVDGRAVAAWSLRRRGPRGQVVVEPFARITPVVLRAIEAEVRDIGRFLNLDLRSQVEAG
jgi:winged helix DNA-binding protein